MQFGNRVGLDRGAFGVGAGEADREGERCGVDVGVYVGGEGAGVVGGVGWGGEEGEVEGYAGLAGVGADVGWGVWGGGGAGGGGWEEEAVGFGDVEVGDWW